MYKKILKSLVVTPAVAGFIVAGSIAFTGNSQVFAGDGHDHGAHAAADNTDAVILKVSGMTCGACANKVKTALEKCEGVEQVEVSAKSGKAIVKVKEGADSAKLIEAVKKAGFKAES